MRESRREKETLAVYRKKRLQSLGAVAIVLVLAACQQEEKAASRPGARPAANQSAEAKSPLNAARRQAQVEKQTEMAPMIAWRKKFQQEISIPAPLRPIRVNETVTIPVVVKNLSEEPWSAASDAKGRNAVHLAYHWLKRADALKQSGNNDTQAGAEAPPPVPNSPRSKGSLKKSTKKVMVVFEGIRTSLPRDLPPGETAALSATIQGPPQEGKFILRLTMVQEGVAWFEKFGGQPLDLPVTVTAR